MRGKSNTIWIVTALALALTLSLAPTTAVAQDDERHERHIRIEKVGASDEKAIERVHKMMFVNEDGEVTHLDGDHEGMTWVKGADGNRMVFEMGDFAFGPGAFLGVGTTELTPELRSHFGVSEDYGVMVSRVVDDTGAFRAGVLVGDIITAVDGKEIGSGHGLRKAIREREEGDAVTLEIWRNGKVESISAILGKTDSGFAFRGMHGDMHGGLHERVMKLDCDDEDENCNVWMSGHNACPDGGECEIKVSCEDDICTCEVDGQETDCDELEGVHVQHHDD